MYVCLCYPTTEAELRKLARKAKSVLELRKLTQAGMGCGTCECNMASLRRYFEEYNKDNLVEKKDGA